jgi:hypothetical protein
MISIPKEFKEDFKNKFEAFQKSVEGFSQRPWEDPLIFETFNGFFV